MSFSFVHSFAQGLFTSKRSSWAAKSQAIGIRWRNQTTQGILSTCIWSKQNLSKTKFDETILLQISKLLLTFIHTWAEKGDGGQGWDSPSYTITVFSTRRVFHWKIASHIPQILEFWQVNLTPAFNFKRGYNGLKIAMNVNKTPFCQV